MNNSATYLLAALREKIKEKGICYSDLSAGMGIPLSTIKRQLHNTSLGLDKILSFATHLDTDLVELSMRAKQLQQENEQFITEINSEIFNQYPYLFDFLYLLRRKEWSLQDILSKYQLTHTSLTLYLRALEMMGYIELKGDDQYRFKDQGRFIFEEGSTLDTLFAKRFRDEVFSHDVRPPICMGRIAITEEQEEKLANEVYNKLIEFDVQNKSGEGSKRLRNVLMTYTPGKQIFLSDTIPNIDGELLKAISMANEK
ncbi:helix-turn-helix domain-containing protein [Vibrio rotiferianus]|jgi:DNA-binding transcriptional ArsR family regulator|uniref:Transcriptional regulator n=1 Tax=Vibrio rotiferianus TaxID=190895 RepID=A0ABX3DAW8_9VIBR|nr:helix-turn-helix domain-containing protein [Vibrio rotiferianus]ASI94343.1 transcriptional regulator [Vibrio rotiferianus]NOH66895.1 helix-turn-helix domain-containing protein [Vibrio rotiferianus]OHY94645.1 transcriptional regulator [Vibrio rotiferianus]CAH1575133.1 Transcriptional regulator [Vibrio rotiferianus]CAH1577216.1 Transcriptional regulator [Vibrio rotiferianus]